MKTLLFIGLFLFFGLQFLLRLNNHAVRNRPVALLIEMLLGIVLAIIFTITYFTTGHIGHF